VSHRRRRGGALAVLAIAAGLVAGVPAAHAADPILPLSGVVPGQVGEARTVVKGTDIVTFPVTILDIQQSSSQPGGALILARAEGPLIASTGGVAEGMSGSPVYVTGADGVARVIGAVAYGTGDEANVIFGITPIEQMLDSSSGARANEVVRGDGATRRAVVVRTRAQARALDRRRPGAIGLYPLQRWAVSGVSRSLADAMGRSLARSGIRLDSIGPRTVRPPVPLVPGATLSVMVAGGDVSLGAIGTVTYVDGPRIYGFGHPFLGAGRTQMLMGDGYVYTTIAAPISGYSSKLAEPGALHGMITDDRTDGVTGTEGPVQAIAGTATATDVARGTTSTIHVQIAPDERLAPLVGRILQDQPLIDVTDGLSGGTLHLTLSVSSPDLRKPVVYRNTYAAAGDVGSVASGELPILMSLMQQNALRAIPISSIRVTERLDPKVKAARILGASVAPRRVRRGQRALLRLRIQPWRASAKVVSVPFRIPRDLDSGPAQLRIVPKSDTGFDPSPADFSQQLGLGVGIGGRRPPQVARMERAARASAGRSRIDRVLAGIARTEDDRHDAVQVLAPGEDADSASAGTTVRVPYVIYDGRAAARITVR
jgi:hypothetical protein